MAYDYKDYLNYVIDRYRWIEFTIPTAPIPKNLSEISEEEWENIYKDSFYNNEDKVNCLKEVIQRFDRRCARQVVEHLFWQKTPYLEADS